MLAFAFFGMINGLGRDRGPAYALEQALLPSTTTQTGVHCARAARTVDPAPALG